MSRPSAAKGSFPYPHRTLAEVFAAQDAAAASRKGPLKNPHHDAELAIRTGAVSRSKLPDACCVRCGARGWCDHRRMAA